jgi:hypothetical protein
MKLRTKTYYVYSPDGTLGEYYAHSNVKPYGSLWKIVRTYCRSEAQGVWYFYDSKPKLASANTTLGKIPLRLKRVWSKNTYMTGGVILGGE